MGGVGGALMLKGLNKLGGHAMGYGPLLGNTHYYPDTPSAPSGGSGGGKSGLTSMLTGGEKSLNIPEDPISLGSASKYDPMKGETTPTQGKSGLQPSWNKGAEKYTPIVTAQAGPDLRALFGGGPWKDK